MIAHLRGTLLAKHPNQVVVETAGVGYEVNISVPTFSELPANGSEVALHIHTHVREDVISLYGFLRPADKQLSSRYCAEYERDLRGETMNKADLVDKIAGACEISKAQATTAIDTTVSSITGALRKGDRVALIGFGTFSISQRKARNGRNPQTGATIKIAARKVAKFTPGAELKKTVNKK